MRTKFWSQKQKGKDHSEDLGVRAGAKRPRREADHSPPSSADVKNAWSYTSTPLYVKVWCLVKQRDYFTLPLGKCGGEGVDWIHLAQDRDQ